MGRLASPQPQPVTEEVETASDAAVIATFWCQGVAFFPSPPKENATLIAGVWSVLTNTVDIPNTPEPSAVISSWRLMGREETCV